MRCRVSSCGPGRRRRTRREHGGHEAHQAAVAAIHADGVGNQIILGPVFAGDLAAVGLKPVQDQLALAHFCDHVAVDGKRRTVGSA